MDFLHLSVLRENSTFKGTIEVVVDNPGEFLSQSHVTDAVAEGVADAADVAAQGVQILEFSMPSQLFERAASGAHGRSQHAKTAEGVLQFVFEVTLPFDQVSSAKGDLTGANKTQVAEKINQVLGFYGVTQT